MIVKVFPYEITLRRDVQQVARVRVEATSPHDAISVAEAAISDDDEAWSVEEHVGSHRSRAKRLDQPARARARR